MPRSFNLPHQYDMANPDLKREVSLLQKKNIFLHSQKPDNEFHRQIRLN